MDEIRFYLAMFWRRLPVFLPVVTVLTLGVLNVAVRLPPIYVSQMRLLVEAPQIPEDLAVSTVRTPALEQLQILEQKLLTRDILVGIAHDAAVFPDQSTRSPDAIAQAMRARTTIRTTSGRDRATLMTVSFEARDPQVAATVLNTYLTVIQAYDAEIRRGRSGETLSFFRQEVRRLDQSIEAQSARILAFRQANGAALPDSLDFRMMQRAGLADRLLQTGQDITRLENQRLRLVQIFEATVSSASGAGGADPAPLSRDDDTLDRLETELSSLLVTYSEANPKVRLLRARIAQIESDRDRAADDVRRDRPVRQPDPARMQARATLDVQLSEIDSEVDLLEARVTALDRQIANLDATIAKTPEVANALAEMDRILAIVVTQHVAAQDRLAKAQTGDLIEARARGQRLTVIEHPNVPDAPSKPNRTLIAAGGGLAALGAGFGLVLILEVLNTTIRRPEDLVTRLGITPLATIPYIQTRPQQMRRRTVAALILVIGVGSSGAILTRPDLGLAGPGVADAVAGRFGGRW